MPSSWKKYQTCKSRIGKLGFQGGVNEISTQQRLMYSIGKTWLWIVRDYVVCGRGHRKSDFKPSRPGQGLVGSDIYRDVYYSKDNNKRGTNLSILAGYLACMVKQGRLSSWAGSPLRYEEAAALFDSMQL
jgi:hypothetical protein